MKIYFDSKDLINILEKSDPCSADDLENILRKNEHEIVLSLITISEISEPLLHKNAKTIVTRLLNRIEDMPHSFLHSSCIPRLELKEAIQAFSDGREYRNINPYVNRFDETVDLYAKPPTSIYLNYSISETVWDLYYVGELGGLDRFAEKLRQVFALDRKVSKKSNLKDNFIKTVERNLSLHKIEVPSEGVEALASWIYEKPTRCPSERLGYEVFHKIVKNITDVPEDSDMEDFLHLGCIPYVDLMTADRRFYGYISQASNGLGLDYDTKIAKTAGDILQLI